MRRADHRSEIATEVARMTHIGCDHLEEIAAHDAAVIESQRRDAESFLPNLGRPGVVGAVRRPANVALMRAIDRPETRPVAGKYRHESCQIRQVIAAVI